MSDSKVVFKFRLEDDLSNEYIILREDNSFEFISRSMLSEETCTGEYQLNDTILLLKSKSSLLNRYSDTLYIQNDTIFTKFDSKHNPIKDFASYFVVE